MFRPSGTEMRARTISGSMLSFQTRSETVVVWPVVMPSGLAFNRALRPLASNSGTVTVTEAGTTRTIAVSGAPNIRTVANHQVSEAATMTIALSPGLTAYSFTFG